MVKQTKQSIASQIDKLNDAETQSVVSYISQLLSKRIAKQKENQSLMADDLIGSLADAYENQRARQVFEWERARRQNAQRAV